MTYPSGAFGERREERGRGVGERRSAMFAMSDIGNAAADFVEAISEYAPIIWEPEDKEALIESLVNRAFAVIQGGAGVDFS